MEAPLPTARRHATIPLALTPLALTGTGTAQYQNAQLLPPGTTGRVLGVTLDVDTDANLSTVTAYLTSGAPTVAAPPPTRSCAYISEEITVAASAPVPFLNEAVDNPLPFDGLHLALLSTWTGACTITGTVYVELD